MSGGHERQNPRAELKTAASIQRFRLFYTEMGQSKGKDDEQHQGLQVGVSEHTRIVDGV